MKISVRPLKAEAFDIDVDPGDSVEALKSKVASVKPDFPAGQQKIVFSGKVLQDGSSVGESGMKEGDFIVVMLSKPKAPAGEAAPPAAAPTPSAAPAAAAAPPPAAGSVGGPALEATVQMMCDMGFPRNLVEQCLRAAFNNPDRAVEYLMSGIPPHLQALASGQAPPQPPAAPAAAPGQAGGGGGFPMMPPMAPVGNATGPLAKLQNHPLFYRLKAAVQANPGSLNEVMSCIEKVDASMIPLIAEHQEEFVRILAEPLPGPMGGAGMPGLPQQPAAAPGAGAAPGAPQDPVAAMLAAMGAAAGQQPGAAPAPAAPGAPAAGGAPPPPAAAAGAGLPQLSEQEQQAVERLAGLGFDRGMALQAYIACDRNEELAANQLFDMADGDDDDDEDN